MAPFNPSTAYKNEWSCYDGTLSATLSKTDANQFSATLGTDDYSVVVMWSGDEPQRIPSGQRLGLSPLESALYLWEAGSGLASIEHGDTVTVESVDYTIINSRLFRYGYWLCEVTKQEVNV